MTDIEIDRALALAIGYKAEDIFAYCDCLEVSDPGQLEGREFSHKDWNVIGPIATKYNMFPYCLSGKWWDVAGYGCPVSYTPQTAIAMAVIQGAKK